MIEAVLFDLDDTLYPQAQWLEGAWGKVCASAMRWGVKPEVLQPAIRSVAAEGSAGGGIIDRTLALLDVEHVPVAELVAAFRAHTAPVLVPYPGARDLLRALRSRVPVGLVTDGYEATQRSKVSSLNLDDAFDVVVYSDQWGRQFRKPHPKPFTLALDALAVAPEQAVFVGDHPVKDVEGPQAIGMRSVRVRTGEYSCMEGSMQPWATVATLVDAADTLINDCRCVVD